MVTLIGGDEPNDFVGSSGSDTLRGNGGNDELRGLEGRDSIYGGSGDDVIYIDRGNDILYGGEGSDFLAVGAYLWSGVRIDLFLGTVTGGAGRDQIRGFENVAGSNRGDYIRLSDIDQFAFGGNGADTMIGLGGTDILFGGSGNDTLNGGAGRDDAAYNEEEGPHGIRADLQARTVRDTFGNTDRLISIEIVDGSQNNDTIQGSSGDNELDGFDGNDTVNGRDGNDDIVGRLGRDTLTGGNGADSFTFVGIDDSAPDAPDTVTDFSQAQGDRINLTRLGYEGDLEFIGTAAFSAAGQVRYGHAGGNTFIEIATTDDGVANSAIRLLGTVTLDEEDFLL